MSRHTGMKKFLDDAQDEENYDEDDGYVDNDLSPEDQTLVEDIEYQFSNQFSQDIIIEVLDDQDWDIDITNKILQETLEMYTLHGCVLKLDKVYDTFYKVEWKKDECERKLAQLIEEKKRKQEILDSKKREQQKKQDDSLVLQKKQSSKLSRKDSNEIKEEKKIQNKIQHNEHHSLKIERFEQETDISKYNQKYETQTYKVNMTEEEKQHSQINLVTVGHVDSGKSTLVGHLRHLLNEIDKREMHKLDKISTNQNKQSFKYAYGQDEFDAERERGVTIDVGFKTITTKHSEINFLDSPGHRDFVPNMISGTAQADYAMLVVDSGPNAFEAGFERGGQTKEHAYLIKAFGVEKVIVAINKMDLHEWDQDRYKVIVNKVGDYLTTIGYQKSDIRAIPLAAFNGQNMVERYKGSSWYDGPCLMELLESLKPPTRDYEKPLRLNVYSSQVKSNIGGVNILGKMEGGIIMPGDKVVCQPHGIIAQIKDLHLNNKKIPYAKSGDNIEAQITLKHDSEERYINSGNVICGRSLAIPIAKSVVVEFVAFDLIYPILKGAEVMIYINTARTEGSLNKIIRLIDKDNGNTLKKKPKSIKSHECAEIKVQFSELLCAEIYSNFKIYGRIILRDSKQTIGVGTIKEIC